MALYRTLRSLNHDGTRVLRDQVLTLTWPQETIDKLIEVGVLAHVSPPPLTELPGWGARAKKLTAQDITDADQFLEADDSSLAKALRVKPVTVKRLKQEVTRWLQPDQDEGCCG